MVMSVQVSVTYQKKPVVRTARDENLTVPETGLFVQIRHDYETLGYPRQRDWGIKYPIPAMMNDVRLMYLGRSYDYVRLDRAWQFFMRDLWSWSVWDHAPMGKWEGQYQNASNPTMTFDRYTAGSLLWYYAEMIQDARSHTDADSVEGGFADYVTGRNMTAKPYSWLCKTTTGNLLKVIANEGKYWRVEALDLAKTPPALDTIIDKPWLLHWATEQSMSLRPDGTYVVDGYPQAEAVAKLLGMPRTGTPIPNVCLGGSYLIEKNAVKPIVNRVKYSPYNPAK
jgi:hypothetical protein